MKRIEKNGITAADLDKAYKDGYNEARNICTTYAMKMGWSMIFLALHDLHGFGKNRLYDVLKRAVERGEMYITADEACKALDDETGFHLMDYNIM